MIGMDSRFLGIHELVEVDVPSGNTVRTSRPTASYSNVVNRFARSRDSTRRPSASYAVVSVVPSG